MYNSNAYRNKLCICIFIVFTQVQEKVTWDFVLNFDKLSPKSVKVEKKMFFLSLMEVS